MNPYLSVVNQRLYFCRLLLEQLDTSGDASSPMLKMALWQSALYQMESAYHFYLREVASTYRCRQPEQIHSVTELVAALELMGKHPSEAQEIANLEQLPGSWLFQLLSAYRQMLVIQQEQVSEQSPIAVVQISPESEIQELNTELLNAWREAFNELIERHRQHMLEC